MMYFPFPHAWWYGPEGWEIFFQMELWYFGRLVDKTI